MVAIDSRGRSLSSLPEETIDNAGPSGARNGRYWIQQIREASEMNSSAVFADVHKVMLHRELYEAAFERMKIRMGAVDPHRIRARPPFSINDVVQSVRDGTLEFQGERAMRLKTKKDGSLKWPEVKKLKALQQKQLPHHDAVVLEVMREILAAIFEPVFSNRSHGYRSDGYNPHTCLLEVKKRVRRTRYFIQLDLQSTSMMFQKSQVNMDTRTMTYYVDGFQLDRETLFQILRTKINDEIFLLFIRRALEGGMIKFEEVPTSLINVPQGTTELAPILFNVYFDALDQFMSRYCDEFAEKESPRTAFEEDYIQETELRNKSTDEVKRERERRLGHLVEAVWLDDEDVEDKQGFVNLVTPGVDEKLGSWNPDAQYEMDGPLGDGKVRDSVWSETELTDVIESAPQGLSSNPATSAEVNVVSMNAEEGERGRSNLSFINRRYSGNKPVIVLRNEPDVDGKRANRIFPGRVHIRGPPNVQYFRYANNIFVSVNAGRSKMLQVREAMERFLVEELRVHTDLVSENIRMQRADHGTLFLGTMLFTRVDERSDRKYLKMHVPDQWLKRCLREASFCDDEGEPIPRTKWYHHDKERIVHLYNVTLNKLLGYYTFTNNFAKASRRITYIFQHSCAKLLAGKHKLRSRAKVFKKWGGDLGRNSVEKLDLRRPKDREYGDFQDTRFFRIANRWWM
eukprot:CAMPEP_0184684142 /NCGR_PEP_ID=MMETSP0312-20130426/14019_1 /TAXON_ID=31354 /ORGANISM="Compsopogon coeruleus, Strain SAG 36.94" /LENGTH=683 /DNA_ID=CAMNT_0027137031 /DNA_START=296 /DNA_END=2347 /DNA_ORIENTATION=+